MEYSMLKRNNIKSVELREIQQILRDHSTNKAKASYQKFVPTVEKVYGIEVSELNKIAIKYKKGDFKLIEELWKAGACEEKILATKILSKVWKKNPEKTIELIKRFSRDISDWVVCDTLATQGTRDIANIKQKEIFKISKNLISSKNLWERRFALVLLINFKKDRDLRNEILEMVKAAEDDKEHYIKKAVKWIKKELK
ncbi:DNA alkylation repair protein [Candidatus Woesearchaeota archaeon]|nr:DNA alkylation repair protein [Candidatus Woesearchaeota archaeon]